MRLDAFRLLADENIHPAVVRFLIELGFDVYDVRANGGVGTQDIELIRLANREQRVILTHDRDFGTLALAAGEPVVGIVYLRPGHIDPDHTIGTLKAILRQHFELNQPFLLVAQRIGKEVKIRLRQL